MTDRPKVTRRDLIRKSALLSCAPLAVSGCARFVSPVRTLSAAAPVDGNVLVPLSSTPELARAGGAVVVQPAGAGSVLLVNSGTGFFALGAKCPHAGCLLTWVPEDRQAECPCHGSRFAGDGTVLNPPAQVNLPHYPADAPDAQGNIVIHLFAGDGVFKNPVRNGQFTFAIADYPALQSVGGVVLGQPDGSPDPLLVARVAAGASIDVVEALSAACPHLGCTVLPARCTVGPGCPAPGSFFQCPCHGSTFDLLGGFIKGPAGSGLLRHATSFDGATVTVVTSPRT